MRKKIRPSRHGQKKRYQDLVIHGVARLRERYGDNHTQADYDVMNGKIRQGYHAMLYEQSNRIFVTSVKHEGRSYYAIYDRKLKGIRTFLTFLMMMDNFLYMCDVWDAQSEEAHDEN